MTSLQELKQLGEEIGLSGNDLKEFIKEQQDSEREERYQQREHERLMQERQLEIDAKQVEAAKEKREVEKERRETRQLELMAEKEKRLHEVEIETERQKLNEKQLEVEFARVRLENLKAGLTADGFAGSKDDNGIKPPVSATKVQGSVKAPKIPCFDEKSDDMDSFLHRFEVYADSQGLAEEQWAVYLSTLLKGRALEVYSRLPVKEAQNYVVLKDALLKRFNLTEEGFKQKFKTAKPETSEAPAQFIARLENYLLRLIELSNVEQDYEGLKNLMIREQYLESCSMQLAIFLRERKLTDLSEIAQAAEQYLEAHASKTGSHKPEQQKDTYRDRRMESSIKTTGEAQTNVGNKRKSTTCYNCGKAGHIARNCFQKHLGAMEHFQNRNNNRRSDQSFAFSQRNPISGNNRPRHDGYVNRGNQEASSSNKQTNVVPRCRAHKVECCTICFDVNP